MEEQGPLTPGSMPKLALALAKAQLKYKPLNKSKTGVISGENKAGKYFEYEYNYADLSDMIDATREALSENGLAITQLIVGFELRTSLLHSSGERLDSTFPLPSGLAPQKFGSALTYYRRYTLGPMLGIAAEEDDDARAVSNEKPKTEPPKKQAEKPKEQPAAPQPQSFADRAASRTPPPLPPKEIKLADFVVPVGKAIKGKKLSELAESDMTGFLDWVNTEVTAGTKLADETLTTRDKMQEYLMEMKR